jgi:HK97 family phage prohead protease
MANKHHRLMLIKEIAEDGTFHGDLAVYSQKDLGGDVILPGAFTKTIQERGSTVPLLWQHKSDEPIGTLTLQDSSDALRVTGKLLMELPTAQKAYRLIKAGVIKGLSIGYDTIKDNVDNGTRYLKELRLWEGSIVTFPMNELATITSIKAMREQKDDFNAELAEQQLQDAGSQIMNALYSAISSLVWTTGMSNADKTAAAEDILSQFHDAFMAYLPAFLDYLDEQYGTMETMARKRMGRKALKAFRVLNVLTTKEGREFSAANKEKLQTAHDHVKSIGDSQSALDEIFQALLGEDGADDSDSEEDDSADSTSGGKKKPEPPPATPTTAAAAKTTEPDTSHSALLTDIIALVKSRRRA